MQESDVGGFTINTPERIDSDNTINPSRRRVGFIVVVENNLLGGNEESQAAWMLQHGKDMASCADAPVRQVVRRQ